MSTPPEARPSRSNPVSSAIGMPLPELLLNVAVRRDHRERIDARRLRPEPWYT